MRLTEKGQVTIPVAIRNQLGLQPGDEVEFAVDGDAIRVVRSTGAPTRGQRLVEHMRGKATAMTTMSTDEIMRLMRGE